MQKSELLFQTIGFLKANLMSLFMEGFIFARQNTINTGKSSLNYKIQYNARCCIWSKRANRLFGFLIVLEKQKFHTAHFTEASMLIPLFTAIVKFSSGLWKLKHLELSVCN